jgi:hypothetical protein
LVFDRDGNLIRSGGEMDMDGVRVAGGWLHSGEVDWEGNVWVVERLNHRILKFNPTLDRALMQLGTTGDPSAASVPDAPPNCSTSASSSAVATRRRIRSSASVQPAAFSPNVIGVACCSQVRPGIVASA